MPRYFCDYCDTYLTHDSPSVRKQHNAGYKHKANVRSYYLKLEEEQTQILIDQKIKERLGQAVAYQQIGAAYNQHLAAFPGQRPRLPMMPPPMLPVPGVMPPQLMAGARPPILPVPVLGAPGYSAVPPTAPTAGQMPPVASLPMQPNAFPAPPALNPLVGVPGGAPPPSIGTLFLLHNQCTSQIPMELLPLLLMRQQPAKFVLKPVIF